MNSMYVPIGSLTPVLHRPNPVTYVCANCNKDVHFNKSVRRWVTNDSVSVICKEAK